MINITIAIIIITTLAEAPALSQGSRATASHLKASSFEGCRIHLAEYGAAVLHSAESGLHRFVGSCRDVQCFTGFVADFTTFDTVS